MTSYSSLVSNASVTTKTDSDQVKNNAGGFVYELDCFTKLERMLITGIENGMFYVSKEKLGFDNYANVDECLKQDYKRTVELIADISYDGKAAKNDQAIHLLAYCSSNKDSKISNFALKYLQVVCRTASHLLMFVNEVDKLRGWGRGLRKAISDWYTDQEADQLAYQICKYRNRNSWTHKDVLRKAHPVANNKDVNKVLAYVAEKGDGKGIKIIEAVEKAKKASNAKAVVKLIRENGLTHEMVPNEFVNDKDVLIELAQKMPLHALIRNLSRYAKAGLLTNGSEMSKLVDNKLSDAEYLRKSRLHPITIYSASKAYKKGQSDYGHGSWVACRAIVDSLNDAFYASFDNVEPTGERYMINLDVSGSMTWGNTNANMTPMEAEAIIALATLKAEKWCELYYFDHHLRKGDLNKNDSFEDVYRKLSGLSFGATDCSLPLKNAISEKMEVDKFVIFTDSESYMGQHCPRLLKDYRQKMGIDAKFIVCGMVSNGFTIADPKDPGMVDICGFSTAVPSLISKF